MLSGIPPGKAFEHGDHTCTLLTSMSTSRVPVSMPTPGSLGAATELAVTSAYFH
jgi:hypothetical protein